MLDFYLRRAIRIALWIVAICAIAWWIHNGVLPLNADEPVQSVFFLTLKRALVSRMSGVSWWRLGRC